MKHHVVWTSIMDERVGYCGRTTLTIPATHMHNDFRHLDAATQQEVCLTCLRGINSYESWRLVNRITGQRAAGGAQ